MAEMRPFTCTVYKVHHRLSHNRNNVWYGTSRSALLASPRGVLLCYCQTARLPLGLLLFPTPSPPAVCRTSWVTGVCILEASANQQAQLKLTSC